MEKWTKIKVDKKIKPIKHTERQAIELIVGNSYFVSFGNSNVYNCTLTNVEETRELKQITIEIPVRPRSKKGYIDINGSISHNWVSSHCIFADEIGRTPEEAVINEVTF